jgi:hypothetical protein
MQHFFFEPIQYEGIRHRAEKQQKNVEALADVDVDSDDESLEAGIK